ncbi:MAG TPA: hydrogenase maturation nickel metallochaperone HypA [Thermoanaerobaculia bacterium]|jgi:hydrogenase nickel incorporation protein HypA/HybF|nr:hydrogenase maturation nickel metallochaperone HypA [Thermoanaerobaculia bacterium]
MHELSIAHSLVELAAEAAEKAGANRVLEVRIVIGVLAGVSVDSLLFCYDIATRDTLLEGSRLAVRELPLVIHCAVCARDVELPGALRFTCPSCDTPSADIRQGREMQVEGIEIETPDEIAPPPAALESTL